MNVSSKVIKGSAREVLRFQVDRTEYDVGMKKPPVLFLNQLRLLLNRVHQDPISMKTVQEVMNEWLRV